MAHEPHLDIGKMEPERNLSVGEGRAGTALGRQSREGHRPTGGEEGRVPAGARAGKGPPGRAAGSDPGVPLPAWRKVQPSLQGCLRRQEWGGQPNSCLSGPFPPNPDAEGAVLTQARAGSGLSPPNPDHYQPAGSTAGT